MKEITVKDCEELKEKFDAYCETADQDLSSSLLWLQVKVIQTLNQIRSDKEVKDQKEANAMFGVLLTVMGENAEGYEIEEDDDVEKE